MILVTLQCDRCGDKEQAQFTARTENDVYSGVKDSSFRWSDKPDGARVLLGPLCFAAFGNVKKDAEKICKETKEDFFESTQNQ